MTLKELLVDGHVLDRHHPLAGLVLGDRVDQQRRIAITEAVEDARDSLAH
jgi:hypothetical protein